MLLAAERIPKQALLAAFARALGGLSCFHSAFDRRHELCAMALERIHGAGADQTLDHPPVHGCEINVFAELINRTELAPGFTSAPDGLNAGLPEIFHCSQSETDGIADRREIPIARIDVGCEHGDTHVPALVDVLGDLGR